MYKITRETFGVAQKKRTKYKCPKKDLRMNFFDKKSEILYLHHYALNTKNIFLILLPTF
jgi:hypothetical protein